MQPDSGFYNQKIFLQAHWEYLLLFNYEVPAEILQPFVPPFTQLDTWNGKALVSLVGFWFHDTKVLGVKWPFHHSFEEVNLRLYVKYFDGKRWKRGVSFISEIVPKPIIAWIANIFYKEHYKALSTRHHTFIDNNNALSVTYQWKHQKKWNSIHAISNNKPELLQPGSEAAFILEHYWGYNKWNDRCMIEYGVEHPSWEIFPVTSFAIDCNIEHLYGNQFLPYLSAPPQSVFLAKGSEVIVRKPVKITSHKY